jgi:hypothetical protein
MKLLNVRLGSDDAAKIRALREQGVEISDLIRRTIRAEYAKAAARRTPRDVKAILEDIYRRHPDSPGQPRRKLDLTDRRALQRYMRRQLLGAKRR